MAFVSGGFQNELDSKHLLRHSKSLSCSLPYLMTSLSMQPLAESINFDQSFFAYIHLSVLTPNAYLSSTIHRQGMLRVTKFVHFILEYITFECRRNEPLYSV